MKKLRPAYTLLELMIVLVIIVALFAIAWPRMQGLSRRAALREAAVDLKVAMGDARDEAVRSGRQVRFAYGVAASDWADVSAPDLPVENQSISAKVGPSVKLPYGISYVAKSELSVDDFGESSTATDVSLAGSLKTDVPDQSLVPSDTIRNSDDLHYVTFFPDGRSTAAEIYLRADDSQETVAISVRAFTGGVKIGPVLRPVAANPDLREAQ